MLWFPESFPQVLWKRFLSVVSGSFLKVFRKFPKLGATLAPPPPYPRPGSRRASGMLFGLLLSGSLCSRSPRFSGHQFVRAPDSQAAFSSGGPL